MPILIRELGTVEYATAFKAQKEYVNRQPEHSELWLLEHPAVYTLGQAGKIEHLLEPNDIPVLHSNRGGQITYHGPGQLIVYTLLRMQHYKLKVRALVELLENSVITTLQHYGIASNSSKEAPGVYVNGAKIAALGLRVSKGISMHGLSLNINCDLSPFKAINPCGYPGLETTSLAQLISNPNKEEVAKMIVCYICSTLGEEEVRYEY